MKQKFIALGVGMLVGMGSPVHASEQEELEIVRQTTINLIQALVEKGVLPRDSADALIRQAEESARRKVAENKAADAKVVRVPYVPESVKREIRDQIKQEVVAQARNERWGDVNAVPEWVGRMKWEGDLRVRYQQDKYPTGNAEPLQVDTAYKLASGTTGNTVEDRERYRLRARLGLTAKISDMVSGAIRLATGSSNEPVSTNQTLGNTANKYSIWLDQAYLKIEPLQPMTEFSHADLVLMGGRMPNPWFGTDLVWDADLSFDGFAGNVAYRFDERRSVYLTAGAFPLQDVTPTTTNKAKSKWLTGVQGGVDLTAQSGSKARFGVALYDYRHVEGIPDLTTAGEFDATKPQYRQRGNTMFVDPVNPTTTYKLASTFRELNLTAQLDLAHFDPMHVMLTGDYVRNIGFDAEEIRRRTGQTVEERTLGYQLQLGFGRPKVQERGHWQGFLGYRYLEGDAVLDAFTDSDFRLGGTDAKGYFLGGSYGLDRNTWVAMKWMSGDSIDGPKYGVDVLQVDLNAQF